MKLGILACQGSWLVPSYGHIYLDQEFRWLVIMYLATMKLYYLKLLHDLTQTVFRVLPGLAKAQ
jgi:hypothetical protein